MTSFDCVVRLVSGELFASELRRPSDAAFLPSDVDWEDLLRRAHDNGVTALCYEALRKLPAAVQPGFDAMLRWDISAEEVFESFELRRRAKEHLCSVLGGECGRIILLKGDTLADNYPDPRMRECGDIDIMLPEGFARSNALIESMGIEVDYSNTKHSKFIFEGVEIENHDPAPHRKYNRNDYLTECLVARSLDDAVLRPDGLWQLPPAVMAVHTLNHIALHLYIGEKIPLKMLIDMAMLLRAHPEILSLWAPALRSTGLAMFAGTVLGAIDTLFGTSWLSSCDALPGSGHSRRCGIFSGSSHGALFIKYFLRDEGSRLSHILCKYLFLPRRPAEIVRELWRKAVRVVKNRIF